MATSEDQNLRDEVILPGQRGTNQAGMRAHNERLVLSLVRRHGALAKSDIARMTGLSAQTVSVIMRALESDRLLRRGQPQRGRVGQPSVPLSLDPDGAFFIGVKVGRRSLDIVLVDFTGAIRHRSNLVYPYPRPADTLQRILAEVRAIEALLGPALAERIAGLGLALPYALWDWAEEIGAPPSAMAAWRTSDLRGELAALLPWPVYLQNDATAACGAELAFGQNSHLQDFIYFYIGTFVGGGVVLNGGLYAGHSGNAGALGSMPVPGPDGSSVQLIDRASLVVLERRLRERGIDPGMLGGGAEDWHALGQPALDWLADAGAALAHAIAAAAAVIDFEAAVIDGAFPVVVQDRLIARTADALRRLDLAGIDPPQLSPGTLGADARALGGASLPLFDRYLLDQHSLMRGG